MPLHFQEHIQAPKNASIARFDGLGCYQSRSEISAVFRAWAAAETGARPGAEWVLENAACGSRAADQALASGQHCRAKTCAIRQHELFSTYKEVGRPARPRKDDDDPPPEIGRAHV